MRPLTPNLPQFDDSSSSASSTDLSSLPYPKPLTRAAFLTPSFDPTEFLSSLHNRHQTLEDLRSELRERSTDLNKELLDLVNSNYEDFLGLGRDLRGGDEKVEELRLGVLGFRREVEGLRDIVREKRREVEGLVEERKRCREEVVVGRGMLEVDRRIGELEERLMLVQNGTGDTREKEGADDDVESEDSEDELEDGVDLRKLRRHTEQYAYLMKMVQKLGPERPFLVSQEERIRRLKETLLLDLGSTLKQLTALNTANGSILKILDLYSLIEEPNAALRVLKEARKPRR